LSRRLTLVSLALNAAYGVNLDESHNLAFLCHFLQGKAGEILPPLVEEWLTRL